MSNGELGAPKTPWAKVSFDPSTLRGVIAPEVSALEDAKGDVRGATERLIDAVQVARKDVTRAEDAQAEKQQAVTDRLNELNLVGRTITVERAVSLPDGEDLGLDEDELADTASVVARVEFGTFNGQPIEPADAIVLHVEEGQNQEYDYAFIADETARFTIGELQTDEQADQR